MPIASFQMLSHLSPMGLSCIHTCYEYVYERACHSVYLYIYFYKCVAPGAMVAGRGGSLPTVRRVSEITNCGGADRSES